MVGSAMAYPMGEANSGPLRVDFNRRLKLEFHGSKITSDAGVLTYRELDHTLGMTDLAGSFLTEARRGKNIRHLIEGLLRQSVFGRLAGYEDVNDAERLSLDPANRRLSAPGGASAESRKHQLPDRRSQIPVGWSGFRTTRDCATVSGV